MGTHKENATCVTEVMSTLLKLKDLAMLSAPPGMEPHNEHLKYAWQRLLAESEKNGELDASNHFLKRCIDDTDRANGRMALTGCNPDQLTGDIIWLTPRFRGLVADTTHRAAELVGDAIAAKWRNGEPDRVKKKYGDVFDSEGKEETLREKMARQGSVREGKPKTRAGSKRHGTKRQSITGTPSPSPPSSRPVTRQKEADTPTPAPKQRGRRASTQINNLMAESLATLYQTDKEKEEAQAKAAPKATPDPKAEAKKRKEERAKKKEKAPPEPSEWDRALGYNEHDEPDFKRFWHDPLRDVLKRSLSMPTVKQMRKEKIRASILEFGGAIPGIDMFRDYIPPEPQQQKDPTSSKSSDSNFGSEDAAQDAEGD